MVTTTEQPYASIVRITVRLGEVNYLGSGVLIAADEVLTAAHLAYSSDFGVATNVVVTPGYDQGVAPFGSYTGTFTHYQPVNDSAGVIYMSGIRQDYAVIRLSTPTTARYLPLGDTFTGGTVTVGGYPASGGGQQISSTQSVREYPGGGILVGTSLGAGSSGGPVYTGSGASAAVVGLVSAGDAYSSTGYFKQFTAADRAIIQSWLAADADYQPIVVYKHSDTGQTGTAALDVATGGPSYLQWQYIWSGDDGVALASPAPNTFLRGGPGQDAIQVTSGQNVLDGGAGSNFLTGGTGADTFFTDARGASVVWNTLRNFHAGDSATLWGFVPGISSYRWEAADFGAPGFEGATLRANIVGGAGRMGDGIDASITFTGMSVAQAQSLQIATGTQQAGPYLNLYASA